MLLIKSQKVWQNDNEDAALHGSYASTISGDRDDSYSTASPPACAAHWHAAHECVRSVVIRAVDLCWLLSDALAHARNQVLYNTY